MTAGSVTPSLTWRLPFGASTYDAGGRLLNVTDGAVAGKGFYPRSQKLGVDSPLTRDTRGDTEPRSALWKS